MIVSDITIINTIMIIIDDSIYKHFKMVMKIVSDATIWSNTQEKSFI